MQTTRAPQTGRTARDRYSSPSGSGRSCSRYTWNGGLWMPTDLIVVLGAVLLTGTVGAVAAWRLLSHAQHAEAARRADESQFELSLRLERAEIEIQIVRKRLAGGAV